MKNIGQFTAPMAKLHGAIDALKRSWTEAQEKWDDETSRNLEKNHLYPLFKQLTEIVEATVPLNDCVGQARRACEPQNDAR